MWLVSWLRSIKRLKLPIGDARGTHGLGNTKSTLHSFARYKTVKDIHPLQGQFRYCQYFHCTYIFHVIILGIFEMYRMKRDTKADIIRK